jgi:hypothetical protein
MKTQEDYTQMSTEKLWQTYNAVMANAYPGDEAAIMAELEKRGVEHDEMDAN